ncbi:NfeD family protein [Azohydromonas aeria]|uniref:NfeD family protein n=1 Tax=Azohydromonas aeria TaxID=2590212 RepID=UPI002872D13A|nr:NfeD family protein [Azohydromonas aeria]
MDLDDATLWWLATAALVLAELASGTFYLLMLALGTMAGALAAHAGLGFTAQLVVAALLGSAATVALWHQRRRRGTALSRDRNLHLDVGERVRVEHWDADGQALVRYRGASWQARHVGPGVPTPGEHLIRAVEGNRLLLERIAA